MDAELDSPVAGAEAPDAAQAPLVPEALIPKVEQPARRPAAPLWQSLPVAVLVLALLSALVWGAVVAGDRWGTAAMVQTAVSGIETYIHGDTDAFAALLTPEAARRLTPADRAAMARAGLGATFEAPVFVNDGATVKATSGSGVGMLIVTPDPSGAAMVTFRTSGILSNAAGAIGLARTWDGWRISGISVRSIPGSGTPPPAR